MRSGAVDSESCRWAVDGCGDGFCDYDYFVIARSG